MNFWKDPSQNATKSLVLIAMVVLAGFGLYKLAGSPDNSQTGKVIQGTKYNITTDTSDPSIKNCSYYSTGGTEGSSCKVQTSSCSTYTGTVQACPDGSNPEFGCCCAGTNDTCYPVNQPVGKEATLGNDTGAAGVSGGITETLQTDTAVTGTSGN